MTRTNTIPNPYEVGSTAIEMAFALPLLVLIVIGIITFGQAYWIQGSLENAVIAAGRYATINANATNDQIITQAQANLYSIDPRGVTFAVSNTANAGMNYKTISATYTFVPVVNVIPSLNGVVLSRQVSVLAR